MSSNPHGLHDLHVSTETRPGPSSFFDHHLLVAIAILIGCALGIAVMVATTVEPQITQERNATDGWDYYINPSR